MPESMLLPSLGKHGTFHASGPKQTLQAPERLESVISLSLRGFSSSVFQQKAGRAVSADRV